MMRPYGCISQNLPTLVSELIDSTSAKWNTQKVNEFFMPMDAKVILQIPICTRNIPDFWSWFFDKKGNFTVRSAYNMLVAIRQRREAWLEGSAGPSSSAKEEKEWKLLWKTAVPGKVRMFLWRLSQHSIPTIDVREHRHMSDSSACGICGAPDSWKHSLVDCTMSRCTWALVDEELGQQIAATSEPNVKQWLFSHMQSLPHPLFVKLRSRYGQSGRLGERPSMRVLSKAPCYTLFCGPIYSGAGDDSGRRRKRGSGQPSFPHYYSKKAKSPTTWPLQDTRRCGFERVEEEWQ